MKMHIAPCLVAVVSLAVSACSADEKGMDIQLKLTDEASAADVGLPMYPGAKPYKDPGESRSGANLGLSTGSFGLKVAAAELESSDRPDKVAAFYKKALARYGEVLECNDAPSKTSSSESEDRLTCDPHEPGDHEVVYKVGVKDHQRIVAIKSHGNGSRFALVHVDVRGESKR
jgi:hypothetical protein